MSQHLARPLRYTLVAAAGLIVGGLASVIVLGRNGQTGGRAEIPVAEVPQATPAPAATNNPMAAIEARLRALEAHETVPQALGTPDAAAPANDPPVFLSEPEQTRRAQQDHQVWIDRYQGEGSDPSWAGDATKSIGADLTQLSSTLGMSVVRVDCKTTMCEAVLEWPTMKSAFESTSEIIQHSYKENCATEFFHPLADDPSKPYRGTVYFDCEKVRTESAAR
jgi:hypothetical protein